MENMKREEIEGILKVFTAKSSTQESYAFTSGYYESMIATIVASLPRAEQAKFLDQITSSRFF